MGIWDMEKGHGGCELRRISASEGIYQSVPSNSKDLDLCVFWRRWGLCSLHSILLPFLFYVIFIGPQIFDCLCVHPFPIMIVLRYSGSIILMTLHS